MVYLKFDFLKSSLHGRAWSAPLTIDVDHRDPALFMSLLFATILLGATFGHIRTLGNTTVIPPYVYVTIIKFPTTLFGGKFWPCWDHKECEGVSLQVNVRPE